MLFTGLLDPKMKILSLFTYPHSNSTQHTLFCIRLNARMHCFHSNQSVNTRRIHVCCGGCRRAYAACIWWVISKMVLRWRGETERRWFVEKKFEKKFVDIIFIFFAYKKYSRRFIKFRLSHWWQMDYPGDAFHSFLDLNSAIHLAVDGTVTSLPVFI